MEQDKVTCKICGFSKSRIVEHLKYVHGLSTKQYKALHPESKTVSSLLAKSMGASEKKYIDRFGPEEGAKKWLEYRAKLSAKNTFEFKQKRKGMTREEFDQFNRSRSCTLHNFVKRYGEDEGHLRWERYCNRQSFTKTLEYFVEKFGQEEGARRYREVCKSHAPTLQSMIRKYGKTVGKERYECFINRPNSSFRSRIADEFIERLLDSDVRLNSTKAYHGESEYGVYLKEIDRYVKVDLYFPDLGIVVEFFGNYWHANPAIYTPGKMLNLKGRSEPILVDQVWQHDAERIDLIEKTLGCKVLVIWEKDWKDDPTGTITKAVDRIFA